MRSGSSHARRSWVSVRTLPARWVGVLRTGPASLSAGASAAAVGAAGEIGLYQIMPSTAAIFEPTLGTLRKPVFRRYEYELGDLADPIVSTRFAMAYLRDILARKPTLREALTEYNGGPRGRQPHYYRIVMATYVEILERPELGCQVRERRPRPQLQLVRR